MNAGKAVAPRGKQKAKPSTDAGGVTATKVAQEGHLAAKPAAKTKSYERTLLEKAAPRRIHARASAEPPSPKLKVTYESGKVSLDPDHPDPIAGCVLLLDAMGTEDVILAEGLLNQIMNVARTGKELTSRDVNTMLATMHAIAPRDATEALLASQMAAIHVARTPLLARAGDARLSGSISECAARVAHTSVVAVTSTATQRCSPNGRRGDALGRYRRACDRRP
jgi:histone H3/H4